MPYLTVISAIPQSFVFKTAGTFALLFLVTACYHLEERVETDELGYRREYSVDAEGLRQGILREYDPEGNLVGEETYLDDQLDGERVIYNEAGVVIVRENYVAGDFEGPYTSYDPQGNLTLKGEYSNGAMNGFWYGYYPDGSLKEEVTFEDNQESGPFREWYPGGIPKASGNYKNGDKEHGTLHLYDEAGELRRVMQCDTGICRTVWSPDSLFAPTEGVGMELPEGE